MRLLSSLRTLAIDLYLRRFRVPRDLTRYAFRRYGERVALITPSGSLTYARLADRVYRLATGLAGLGLRKGDRFFTLLPDDWEQIEVRLAAMELGAVQTAFHGAHAAELILEAARTAQPRVFIYHPSLGADIAHRLAHELEGIQLLAVREGATYEALIGSSLPRRSENPVAPSDPAALGFTSGTTGRPKALFVTHGTMITSLRLTALNVRIMPSRQPQIAVLGIPLVGAGSGLVLPTLFTGGVIILPPAYEAGEVLRLVEQHRATRIFITPSQLIDILDLPDLDRYDLSSLRNVIYGTASTPAAKIEEALRRFGPIFQQGYGMAEVLPPVSLLQMEDHVRNGQPAPRHVLSSVGQVVPQVSVQIVDEAERPLPPGGVGQVLIASPTTFGGYWQRPDLTEQALRGGWFRTGDYGYFDAEGRLHILDREANLIRRRGYVIYPRLVEEAIHYHPAVKEACLVDGGAQGVVLCVSLRHAWRDRLASPAFAEELRDFLIGRIEDWQMPDRVRLYAELPRSYLRKVLHRDVRASLAQPETTSALPA
ncbi:MAG: AMP-binding protein [Anaerolineales bacterium]|nr:AMP-binding protein [Anaerolineales bacterium]